jgi:DNA-binding Lrp family transcriptional regulator
MTTLDDVDRQIINNLQGGFPISDRPYAKVAATLGMSETELIRRLQAQVESGLLSRFGPLYRAERMGGAVTLVAMQIPEADLDRVIEQVNAHPEVAHNYQRDHRFNLWFVLAVDREERIEEALEAIAAETGYRVYNMPKLEEFYIGLQLAV